MEEYLRSTYVINCDSSQILEKAGELTSTIMTQRDKAINLFYFVRDEISHEPYAPGYVLDDYKASTTLARGNGFCTHKAILLTALARAINIPARLGFVDIYDNLLSFEFRKILGGGNLLIYHGYSELFIGNRWIHASPAYDLNKCDQYGFVPVEFDGINSFKDSRFNGKGRPHIEWVNDHGTYADFPWDEISQAGKEFWSNLGKDWTEVGKHWRGDKMK